MGKYEPFIIRYVSFVHVCVYIYICAFAHAVRLIISKINLAVFLREVVYYSRLSSGIGIFLPGTVSSLRQGMPTNLSKEPRKGLAFQ